MLCHAMQYCTTLYYVIVLSSSVDLSLWTALRFACDDVDVDADAEANAVDGVVVVIVIVMSGNGGNDVLTTIQ